MPKLKRYKSPSEIDRIETLRKLYGGFMNISDIMNELNVSRNTAKKFVSDIDEYHPTGKAVYSIEDIASKIEKGRVRK